jgi:hypothetical protein
LRRNPLGILSALAAFYIYLLLRGLGRGLVAIVVGLPVRRIMIYKVLPTFDALSNTGRIAPGVLATFIIAGPLCALLAGYLLLALISLRGEHLPPRLRLLLCFTCYLSLTLDPIYYAVISLLRLGGEPDKLAQITGAPSLAVTLPAMALLGLNVMLTRSRLIPVIRNKPRR